MSGTLHVWREGGHVGVFVSHGEWDVRFSYDEDAPAGPISLSLPRDGGWSRNAPRAFLRNLLPEDPRTRVWMARFTGSAPDDFGLLDGADTVGGLTFTLSDEPHVPEPKPLRRMGDMRIAARIAAVKCEPDDRWETDRVNKVSLAGAQAKFSLTRLGHEWYRSNDHTPSTHIFKPESPHTPDAELVEAACMRLSSLCRIDTPTSGVARFDDQTTFWVERFDRRVEDGRIIRLHCEDLLQSMGLSAEHKYGVKARQVLALLHRADPTDALSYRWLERLAFNVGINNVDAHAKNYSIMLGGDGPTLAPMYDAMTTTYWKWVEPLLAMPVGNNRSASQVTARNWETMAERNGLDPERTATMARVMAGRIIAFRETAFDGLPVRVRDGLMRETDRACLHIGPIDPRDAKAARDAYPQGGGATWVRPHVRAGRPVAGYWRPLPPTAMRRAGGARARRP